MIIDTDSNISIVQPGISKSEIKHTDMRPYGVTGETLDVTGRQTVSFILGGREFNHQFLVCSLPTDADGLLGMDFLRVRGYSRPRVQENVTYRHRKSAQSEWHEAQ